MIRVAYSDARAYLSADNLSEKIYNDIYKDIVCNESEYTLNIRSLEHGDLCELSYKNNGVKK